MNLPTSRFFRVRVARVTHLTPSFRRFTFVGDDLGDYGDPGFDQRVKVIFPARSAAGDVGIDAMPMGESWYAQWRELPNAQRPPIRTYTTRAVRRDPVEVDIDMVMHPILGPASAWINAAEAGDEVLIWAPTVHHQGVSLGIDFVPPARTDQFLLAGDETAAPAISAILEQLPPTASGVVVLELPDERDAGYLPRHPGFVTHVQGRDGAPHGSRLVASVAREAARLLPPGRGAEVEEVDIDEGLLWEVPRTAKGAAALKSAPVYAWLAGEAAAIKALRRLLVTEHGLDRRAVAFMGYWRLGRAEN